MADLGNQGLYSLESNVINSEKELVSELFNEKFRAISEIAGNALNSFAGI